MEEHTGGLGVSHVLLGWLKLLMLGQFSGFPLANHLAPCPYVVWLRALSNVRAYLLAKMDSSARVSRRLAGHIMGWHPFPSLTPEDLFCVYVVWEVFLTQEQCGLLIFYSVRVLLLLLSSSWSVNRRQVPAAQPGAQLSPASGQNVPLASAISELTLTQNNQYTIKSYVGMACLGP